jgi:hypothetical protein
VKWGRLNKLIKLITIFKRMFKGKVLEKKKEGGGVGADR